MQTQSGEYLGFGLGAASYWNGMRFENTREIQDYVKNWDGLDINKIRRNIVPDTQKSQMEEFMFLGLRLMCGVSKIEFEQRFGVSMEEVYGTVIQKYEKQGYLTWNHNYLKLTDAGIDVSNIIMADFLLDETS